ncbi:magnesium transporter [Kordia sp. TARA_039_SRF]|nr:magnesium transporter [Kordia sp. TARA_039_SRF]MAF32290.1 magnesium transporter [Magnetococcales bacterium]|tara:strand:- start:5604 stop:6998 length:1395 start_codon:yes stop_codon:yes gene_type:complete
MAKEAINYEDLNEESQFPIGLGLTDEIYGQCLDILAKGDEYIDDLDPILEALHPADIADLIERLPLNKRELLLTHIPPDYLGETIAHLHDEAQEATLTSVINTVSPEGLLEAVESLESDDRTNLLRAVEERQGIVYEEEQNLLTYDKSTAGGIMQTELVAVSGEWEVDDVLSYMRENRDKLPETVSRVFVVAHNNRLLGSISLSRLVRKPLDARMEDVMRTDSVVVPYDMNNEDVARLFEKYDMYSCAVVGEGNKLLGKITVDDILDVIIQEQEADLMRAAGLEEGQDLFAPVWFTSKKRFPWLLINLFTAILASIVIANFEAEINQLVALAVLMPIVASMGGNAGTQSMTVAVRGLATKQLTWQNAGHLLWKELRVGGFNGLALGLLLSVSTILWYENPNLGYVIGAATIINHLLAAFAGIVIPVMLEKMGKDPAVSAGVLLTTVTDVGGFFSFLGLAALFLT